MILTEKKIKGLLASCAFMSANLAVEPRNIEIT
jgi:hypothetical protein